MSMWYVIWTSTGQEHNYANEVGKRVKDATCFVPVRKINRKRKGQWYTEDAVLFPGYFFVDTEDITRVNTALRSTEGFGTVLNTDREYMPLNFEETEFIDDLNKTGGVFDTSKGLIDGDQVKITSGPLYGYKANIRKIDRHKRRAYIEMDMFGKTIKTFVGLEIVERT